MWVLLLFCVWCCWEAIDGCDDLALLCLGLFSVGDCWSDFLITGLPLWLVMPPNEAIAPALLWSSVDPRRPWAWRGEEFFELLPLAISVERSTKYKKIQMIKTFYRNTILLATFHYHYLQKLPLIFPVGLSAFEDVLDVETRGDEVCASFLLWICFAFELLWLCSFETTIFVDLFLTESGIGELSPSSSGPSDSMCVSSRSSFPRELECEEFDVCK